MASADGPCYTIINSPELTEVYNEMKLKKDLGKVEGFSFWMQKHLTNYNFLRRTRRWECPNWYIEEGDQTTVERWTASWIVDDNHTIRYAITESYNQEVAFDFLGNRSENNTGRQIIARNDSCLWRLSKGLYIIYSRVVGSYYNVQSVV